MTLQRAVLTIEADVDGDGSKETGKFHFVGNLEITPSLRTGYLIGGQNSQVNSIIANLVDDGESKRKQFTLDLGAGQHVVEVSFRGWEGAKIPIKDADGNITGYENVQWGNDSAITKTQASATGQDPITQIDCLMQYLLTAEIDSRNPATLEYGEFSSSGLYDPLQVVVEGPNMTKAAEDGSWFDGTITLISTADLNETHDGQKQTGT